MRRCRTPEPSLLPVDIVARALYSATMAKRKTWVEMVRAAIARIGCSQNALARAAGVDSGHLSRIMGGRTRAPSLETLRRIEEVTGVPVAAWEATK